MRFKLGDKVYVKGNWNFPDDCKGEISCPPEFAIQLVSESEPWEGIHRFAKGRKGPIEFFWVKFDQPQRDSDGDGPYKGGEIEAEYLTLIE